MRISDWSSDVCSSDLGRWKEQHFRAHERHDARSFRIPLGPAYADANRSVAGFPHLEAAIAGAEIVIFFIAWPVGNMTFAIDAHDFAGIIDHGQRVIMMLPVTLEEAGRDIDVELGRQSLHGQQIGRAHAELQSLMRISYAVFCLKKKKEHSTTRQHTTHTIATTT